MPSILVECGAQCQLSGLKCNDSIVVAPLTCEAQLQIVARIHIIEEVF